MVAVEGCRPTAFLTGADTPRLTVPCYSSAAALTPVFAALQDNRSYAFIYKGKYSVEIYKQVENNNSQVFAIVENTCNSGIFEHNFAEGPNAGQITVERTGACNTELSTQTFGDELTGFLESCGLQNVTVDFDQAELEAHWYDAIFAYVPEPPRAVSLVPIEGSNGDFALGVDYDNGDTKVITVNGRTIAVDENLIKYNAAANTFTYVTADNASEFEDFETIELGSNSYLSKETHGVYINVIAQSVLIDGTNFIFSNSSDMQSVNAVGYRRMQIVTQPLTLYTVNSQTIADDSIFNELSINGHIDILFNTKYVRITKVSNSVIDLGVYANDENDVYTYIIGGGKVVDQTTRLEGTVSELEDEFTSMLEDFESSYVINFANRISETAMYNGMQSAEY